MNAWRAMATLGIAVVFALAPAAAASAAGEVQLSSNGVTYGTTLPAPVFDSASMLVPMQSISGDFWVRNASSVSAYLRLTLEDATWSSAEYGARLSLSADVPGHTGAPVNLATTAACNVILYGVLLAPGASVTVTATMAMGDADGTSSQSGWAAVSLGVTLIEAAGQSAASDCSVPTTPVVVVPPHKPGGTTDPVPEDEGEVVVPGDGDEEEPDEEPGGFLAVLANTLSSFDSGILGVATASIPLGAGLFFMVGFARRRRENLFEEEES